MRSRMLKTLVLLALGVASAPMIARASAEEPASVDAAKAEAKPAEVAESDAAEEYKPPPGFMKKRRGDVVVYCEKRAVIGTRVKTEKCYDENALKVFLLEREQQNREMEQRRGVCSDPGICSPQ